LRGEGEGKGREEEGRRKGGGKGGATPIFSHRTAPDLKDPTI